MMHENLVRMKAVALALKDLKQDYVFVGGATVALYATDSALSTEVRPTDDVDVIVELATYKGYSELDARLRAIGFQNDILSGVICRYKIQGIIVDVMPTDPQAIGFSNRWYPEGFATAKEVELDEETTIKVFTLPYFIASKWEAFKGRGQDDYRTSKDFEDLVYILENVDDLEQELKNGPEHVQGWLREEIGRVIDTDNFEEGLYAHLAGGYGGMDAGAVRLKLSSALGN